jgi:hypothetical protein
MLLLLQAAALLLCLVSAPVSAIAQDLQVPAQETPQEQQKRLYGAAHSYLNDPIPEMEKAVPDLHGLQPGGSPQDLPGLLTKVGRKEQDLLTQMPNLTAREEVVQAFRTGRSKVNRKQEFNYLILLHEAENAVTLTEYRTDLQNRRIGEFGRDPRAPAAQGFALIWMYFHPTRRSESQFRYLGEQKVDGHKTFAVAFAQTPGLVQFPAQVYWRAKEFPLLYQGVAWIDDSDFRIVRLRTDLLAPQPDAHVLELTTEVEFADVRISHRASSLWLPRKALVEWQSTDSTPGGLFELERSSHVVTHAREQHSYSDYQLYEVEVKINPPSR